MALPRLETDLNNVQTLPNQPRAIDGYTPEVIKALIDKAPNDIKDYLVSTLLPYLEGTAGAENIGLPETISGSGANVKARVEWLRTQINNTVLGQIPDGSLTDEKLSNEEGQIKDTVTKHLAEKAQLAELGHVEHGVITTTLDTTWTGASAPYTKTQAVAGILATDTPIVDVVMSGTYATDDARQSAWGNIYRITTADSSITLYAKEKPTISLPIQLKVVR